MPIDDLKAFFAKLETDADLQAKARALQDSTADERVAGLCALAADAGFTVTAEDLKSAAAELDDQSLRAVVGGICESSGFFAPHLDHEFQG